MFLLFLFFISFFLKGLNIPVIFFMLSTLGKDKTSNMQKHKQVVNPALESVFLALNSESKVCLYQVSCLNSQENLPCCFLLPSHNTTQTWGMVFVHSSQSKFVPVHIALYFSFLEHFNVCCELYF